MVSRMCGRLATISARKVDRIITDKISSADVTTEEELSEEEEEMNDTTPILPVTNALDHVDELRTIICN